MGPLGDPVEAAWRLSQGHRRDRDGAGLGPRPRRAAPTGNDPIAATTYGTGELIVGRPRRRRQAHPRRRRRLGHDRRRARRHPGRLRAPPPPAASSSSSPATCAPRFVDAAEVFAAAEGGQRRPRSRCSRRRLERLAQVYEDDYGVDVRALDGAGAAGGLAGGLAALGGELVPGFDVVADELDLAERIEAADLVVTGEGFVDEQSFEGKVVGGVAELAERSGTRAARGGRRGVRRLRRRVARRSRSPSASGPSAPDGRRHGVHRSGRDRLAARAGACGGPTGDLRRLAL